MGENGIGKRGSKRGSEKEENLFSLGMILSPAPPKNAKEILKNFKDMII